MKCLLLLTSLLFCLSGCGNDSKYEIIPVNDKSSDYFQAKALRMEKRTGRSWVFIKTSPIQNDTEYYWQEIKESR